MQMSKYNLVQTTCIHTLALFKVSDLVDYMFFVICVPVGKVSRKLLGLQNMLSSLC